MSVNQQFKIRIFETFRRNAKVLSKKYPSFKNDLKEIMESLIQNPFKIN
jgi:mRNA-degrading endonuclease YafQ of YafQ-DinJ toxin-antitoxin module